jgi:hypothetical protein
MPNVYIPLDQETYRRLVDMAIEARRPLKQHASVLLRKAVGLPFGDPTAGLNAVPLVETSGASTLTGTHSEPSNAAR